MSTRRIHIKSADQLETLSTQRLLGILTSVRAVESCIQTHYGPRCCDICHEYIGSDYEKDVLRWSEPFTEYKNQIKSILSAREHQPSKLTKKVDLSHHKRYVVKYEYGDSWGRRVAKTTIVCCASTKKIRAELNKLKRLSNIEILEVNGRPLASR